MRSGASHGDNKKSENIYLGPPLSIVTCAPGLRFRVFFFSQSVLGSAVVSQSSHGGRGCDHFLGLAFFSDRLSSSSAEQKSFSSMIFFFLPSMLVFRTTAACCSGMPQCLVRFCANEITTVFEGMFRSGG